MLHQAFNQVLLYNHHGVNGPTTNLEFLGIMLDSVALEARLPFAKLPRLRLLLETWQGRKDVEFFFQQGVAKSTSKTYGSGWRRFQAFCIAHNITDPLPETKSVLCSFAAYLAKEGLSHQTIKTYLSAIRFFQIKDEGPEPPTPGGEHAIVIRKGGVKTVSARNFTPSKDGPCDFNSGHHLSYYLLTLDTPKTYKGRQTDEYKVSITILSMPKLKVVNKGIKKVQALSLATRTRLLITPSILRRVRALWSRKNRDPDTIMLWAACTMCFF